MNLKWIVLACGILVLVGMLTSQGLVLNFFTDAEVERHEAQEWLDEHEETIIIYLIDSDFKKPTNKPVEIYELVVDGETKLKGEIDWLNLELTILDEDGDEEADLTIYMREGTYNKAVERFKAAVENRENVGGFTFYLEVATSVRLDREGHNRASDFGYKLELISWINSNYEGAAEDYEDMRSA